MTVHMTEADFARRVIDYARLRGWHVAHYRPARTLKGWRTPLEGHPGAPDLILARREVVILAELKSQIGRMRPGQAEWGRAIGTYLHRVWRPSDWPEIEAELR